MRKAKQLELPLQTKETVLGVTRKAVSLTTKTASLVLDGIGALLAAGHNAVDIAKQVYAERSTHLIMDTLPEFVLVIIEQAFLELEIEELNNETH